METRKKKDTRIGTLDINYVTPSTTANIFIIVFLVRKNFIFLKRITLAISRVRGYNKIIMIKNKFNKIKTI